MRLAVTGGTGLVGRFIVEAALRAGVRVTVLSRTTSAIFSAPVDQPGYSLGEAPNLNGIDALVHCAFCHLPGRYRGGEGHDPDGFVRVNLDGSLRLFEAARSSGVGRVIFLSSRAVYGSYPPGTELEETLPPRPDTLYGEVKWWTEQALTAMTVPGFTALNLRATGVYGPAGPGRQHKWAALFADYLAGHPIAARCGTELHGDDLAAAVMRILETPPDELNGPLNASDIVLDRHDLLALVAEKTGCPHPLPPRAETPVSVMRTRRLRQLGWQPGGLARLRASLPALLKPGSGSES
ncbi:nucleoside-diphosphate-sugar epimerase [Rhodovulum imhoffii]|uniref:Nucleoside-diphosphate-sugar epimerase n=1 Tax=Rhodovulum imhoffii TaxID=365340 RepID=A0A2T5BTG6_9RHOB|nr:NAD(P)-dependent oxidoreductase [Rhodovulum imhoffii]MBK5934322.1 hypothetical protein [Rhodovulum imhoffii]PTN02727.1 nucleoside-diphosphate-sugar epimerase [Rhodovulum imhoffii]